MGVYYDWDEESCCLTLEFQENGDLATYMKKHWDSIPRNQRDLWMVEAANALTVVHTTGAVHCDVTPRNFLLGKDLHLRIADFGGSSISGSPSTITTSPRFQRPGWRWDHKPEMKDDIFALGSLLYFIETGSEPYPDVSDEVVQERFCAHEFPDLSGLESREVIQRCWTGDWKRTEDIAYTLSFMYTAAQTRYP